MPTSPHRSSTPRRRPAEICHRRQTWSPAVKSPAAKSSAAKGLAAWSLAAVLCSLLAAGPVHGFEYRGAIRLGGAAVGGQLDVLFTLFDAAEGGSPVGEAFLAEGVTVQDDDSFTVEVDFGRVDDPGALWLEVHILKAGAFGPFEALKPRRPLGRSPQGELQLALKPPPRPSGAEPASSPAGRRIAPLEGAPGQRPSGLALPALPAGASNGRLGTLRSDLTPLPPGIDLATGRPVGSALPGLGGLVGARPPGAGDRPGSGGGTLIQDLTLPAKASATPLYAEFGWQGSSGADLSNFASGDHVLRITEEATSNLFEVDFGHLVPGTPITRLNITITEPGHYYLIGNLSNQNVNRDGITIDTDNVTIDMNGYTLYGGKVSGVNSDDGIVVLGSQTNLKVYNGSVVGWQGDGINGLNADFSIFKDLHVALNDGDGLVTDFNCLMERVTSFSNGLDGIEGDDGSVIIDCTAGWNDDNGIQASEGCVVVDSASYDNRVDGFDISAGGLVKNCSASGNGTFGFDIGLGTQAVECAATDNASNGFDIASACILRSCIASENQGHGIRTFANAWIIDNTSHGNTIDGIRASSTDAHIEGNQVTDNGRTGVLASSSGNFIVRNVARGNQTNFAFANNNSFGPVIDVGGIGDLTNNAAASHPWANFAF